MIQGLLAAIYGFIAGLVAALVLWAMGLVNTIIWSGPEAGLYIFAAIMVGGIIIAALRHISAGQNFAAQLDQTREPGKTKVKATAILALSAIVAVGFGGAIGPEAGILAVVAEVSALVTYLLGRLHRPTELVGEIGAAGALGGIYASPPGAAMLLDEDPSAPKWQLYLASLTGLAGFMILARHILPENSLQVDLPAYTAAGNGSDIILAILPALLGAGMGVLFIVVLKICRKALAQFGNIWMQTIVGTFAFAILAAFLPILRFSGHHELHALMEWGQNSGFAALLFLAVLKVLALALCLAAGWRGGAIFPLIFAGAAAGGASLWLLPDLSPTVALVAGIGAAMTVGMGKPLAAMLIAILLISPLLAGPLCTGLLVGFLASKLVPKVSLH